MCVIFRIILVIFSVTPAFGLNILGVFPHVGKSHTHVFKPVMKGLADKGHNVTVISFFPLDRPVKNYRDVALQIMAETTEEMKQKIASGEITDTSSNLKKLVDGLDRFLRLETHNPDNRLYHYGLAYMLSFLGKEFCELSFKSKALQDFLMEDNHFDVIINEEFNTDCMLGLNEKYQAPMIGISSTTMMPWTPLRYGNPNHPGYIPNNFLALSDKMSFLERVENVVINKLHELFYYNIVVGNDRELVEKYLGKSAADLDKFIYNISLFLTNSHFTLTLPRPLVPGAIEIGGVHIGKAKPLPQNLKKFIDESEHGVIYFSFGSMVKTHTMSPEKLQAFFKAFSRLPQRVLWKWENETMQGKPDNVMFQKWMPQFDILSHKNVKAFISHGGLLGSMEAVHCGVPMVVMPQFGDQHTNAKAIEASGGGIILGFNQVTEETLYKALQTILSPSFQTQAMDLSERFRDRPLPPLETAIYWVEYVARHRGAPHLRTAAVGMPWYQYYLIDVISFLLLMLGLYVYICYVIVRYAINRLTGRSSNKVKTS